MKDKQFVRLRGSFSNSVAQALGMIHIWPPWKLSNFQDLHILAHLRPKFFHPLDLGRPFQALLALQMITNQLKENIVQGWLLYIIRSFLKDGLCFQYQNLVWLSFDLFSFSLSPTICLFVALYCCICSCSKISQNVFYYNYSHF